MPMRSNPMSVLPAPTFDDVTDAAAVLDGVLPVEGKRVGVLVSGDNVDLALRRAAARLSVVARAGAPAQAACAIRSR
ncbi:hypothetical protein BZL54_28075 [Burkholderia ubonensis subsp. mesacidophila]|uniref:Uncharacterized protein n=1 Tax=Burkholderia ubonensis subsp. mesacidophila TaxID=265293 RepID=A0A2A4F9S3_9BURK|nr:hypothetical protein BZL54_28075 [Burkholderia ubonensis subsp. mesacidophila]